jgi:hypothetical protein
MQIQFSSGDYMRIRKRGLAYASEQASEQVQASKRKQAQVRKQAGTSAGEQASEHT